MPLVQLISPINASQCLLAPCHVLQHFSGKCNYGNWCGEDCMGKQGIPVDTLDEHCKEHDKCLTLESDPCLRCLCHATLLEDIDKVGQLAPVSCWLMGLPAALQPLALACLLHCPVTQQLLCCCQMLEDKGCGINSGNWASDGCQSYEAVKEAPTITIGIQYRMDQDSCGSYAWAERCNSQPASDNYSEEVLYRYEVIIGTSCNAGAGTDGYVQVKFTDET